MIGEPALLTVRDLSLAYGTLSVVNNLSFDLAPGLSLGIMGPSGCGKSSILSAIAGLMPRVSGVVQTDCSIAYMQQKDLLLPWLQVIDNVTLPLLMSDREQRSENSWSRTIGKDLKTGWRFRRTRRLDIRRLGYDALQQFGLEDFAAAYPSELSGGMRQRVALLRAIMQGSSLLLLDEPFAGLDAWTRHGLYEWIRMRIRPRLSGLVLVTHDIEEALELADKTLVLSPRPAAILGSVDISDGRESARHRLRQLLFGQE